MLAAELDALGKAMDNPARPLVAIVGGSKVSTKLTVLESLSGIVDQLVVGGGIANTFIAAAGHPVGKSLYEADLIDEAKRLVANAQSRGGDIPVPTDVVVGKEFSPAAVATLKPVAEVADDEMIFDIGPDSAEALAAILQQAGTIVWNGPVGVFEFDQFGEGTKRIAQAIAESPAFSIAGGGDTLAAVDKYGIATRCHTSLPVAAPSSSSLRVKSCRLWPCSRPAVTEQNQKNYKETAPGFAGSIKLNPSDSDLGEAIHPIIGVKKWPLFPYANCWTTPPNMDTASRRSTLTTWSRCEPSCRPPKPLTAL